MAKEYSKKDRLDWISQQMFKDDSLDKPSLWYLYEKKFGLKRSTFYIDYRQAMKVKPKTNHIIGNKYWHFRNKHGRNFKYTPEKYWEEAIKYFEWISGRKWYHNEAIKGGDKAGKLIKIPTETPMSIESFCVFADISLDTFLKYESNKDPYKDFHDVSTRIRSIIESQQFEGATVGVFNHSIIARKLGLVDKKATEHSGEIKVPPIFNLK